MTRNWIRFFPIRVGVVLCKSHLMNFEKWHIWCFSPSIRCTRLNFQRKTLFAHSVSLPTDIHYWHNNQHRWWTESLLVRVISPHSQNQEESVSSESGVRTVNCSTHRVPKQNGEKVLIFENKRGGKTNHSPHCTRSATTIPTNISQQRECKKGHAIDCYQPGEQERPNEN